MGKHGIYFTRLLLSKLDHTLDYLVKNEGTVTIWPKGQMEQRETVNICHYQEESRVALFSPSLVKFHCDGQEVLFSFSIKGVWFFGRGRVADTVNTLSFGQDFFKWERRGSIRLLLAPGSQVACALYPPSALQEKLLGKPGQVIKRSGFASELPVERGQLVFEVQDISVGGLALRVSPGEQAWFSLGELLEDVSLFAGGEKIAIPQVKVIRLDPPQKTDEQFKVALQFFQLPLGTADQLGYFINRRVKKYDMIREFERFLA